MIKNKLFVDKEETINVTLYVGVNKKEDLVASHKKEEVLEEKDIVTKEEDLFEVVLKFRRPNYKDDMEIISDSVTQKLDMSGESVSINPALVRYSRLNQLLVDWDLTDDEGKKIKVNIDNINNLSPSLANAILNAMDAKVIDKEN